MISGYRIYCLLPDGEIRHVSVIDFVNIYNRRGRFGDFANHTIRFATLLVANSTSDLPTVLDKHFFTITFDEYGLWDKDEREENLRSDMLTRTQSKSDRQPLYSSVVHTQWEPTKEEMDNFMAHLHHDLQYAASD